MGYETYLKELLRPLGVYKMDGIGGGELAAEGEKLDECFGALEHTAREMLLATAEDAGLAAIASLLPFRPVTANPSDTRAALAALLRVGGDSFTAGAISDNLRGCGLNATAKESSTQKQTVEVRFPDDAGIPDGIERIQAIIEDILPCHLNVEYIYHYLKWEELERYIGSWGELEARRLTWEALEKLMK